MKAKPLVASELAEWFVCDHEEGTLRWKKNFHTSKIGSIAGSLGTKGYKVVKLNGRLYSVARILWCMYYGSISDFEQIDHIDRNRKNNTITNLRLVSASENCFNRSAKYGEPRYCTEHKSGKFQAQKQGKYLGLFSTPADATKAAMEMK